MLLNKLVSLYHHSGIVFTTNYDSDIRPALQIKRDSSSFEVIATPCWIIPYFKLLIWNSSQGMRWELSEDKWHRRNKDKNVLFDLARGEISLPTLNAFLYALNEPVSLYQERNPWVVHGLQSCFPLCFQGCDPWTQVAPRWMRNKGWSTSAI